MTDLRTAAQQALEALESLFNWQVDPERGQQCGNAVVALRAALVEDAMQKFTDVNQELEAALAEPTPLEDVVTHGSAWSKDGKRIDPMSVYAEPVQEPVACEPQYANDDGWCEWVCPQPRGYLMQCCDCGLIHEVDSRVAKYQPRPSEEFEVVDDPDLQVQWRMKRRDDISPKRKPLTEDEIALIVADCSASAHRQDDFHFARAIERAHNIKE